MVVVGHGKAVNRTVSQSAERPAPEDPSLKPRLSRVALPLWNVTEYSLQTFPFPLLVPGAPDAENFRTIVQLPELTSKSCAVCWPSRSATSAQ